METDLKVFVIILMQIYISVAFPELVVNPECLLVNETVSYCCHSDTSKTLNFPSLLNFSALLILIAAQVGALTRIFVNEPSKSLTINKKWKLWEGRRRKDISNWQTLRLFPAWYKFKFKKRQQGGLFQILASNLLTECGCISSVCFLYF